MVTYKCKIDGCCETEFYASSQSLCKLHRKEYMRNRYHKQKKVDELNVIKPICDSMYWVCSDIKAYKRAPPAQQKKNTKKLIY